MIRQRDGKKPLLGYEKKLDADYADDTDYSPP